MDKSLIERITALETIIKIRITKLVESVESLKEIEVKLQRLEELDKNINQIIKEAINDRLNTIEFDKGIRETTHQEVKKIFDEKEVREDLETKVRTIAQEEDAKQEAKVNKKILGVIGGLAAALIVFYLEGFIR